MSHAHANVVALKFLNALDLAPKKARTQEILEIFHSISATSYAPGLRILSIRKKYPMVLPRLPILMNGWNYEGAAVAGSVGQPVQLLRIADRILELLPLSQ
jgi:hypothetical protein